jgi:hypothetical protein
LYKAYKCLKKRRIAVSIIFNESNKTFYLNGKDYSYVFYINKVGYPTHLHFGAPIPEEDLFFSQSFGSRSQIATPAGIDDPKLSYNNALPEISFYGTGDYRVCIYLKQILVCYDGSELTTEIKSPENAIYNLAVNTHSCANGILNAEGNGTLDFQVNVINEESDVAYFPGSKINVGDTLKIGVSLSQDMQKKLSNVFSSIGARGTLDLYVYSNTEKKWVKLDSQAFAKGREDFANVTLEFASEELKNGRYRLVMSYNSLFEHIEEAYEYYFVFER